MLRAAQKLTLQVLAPDAKSQGKQRIRVAKWYGKQRELAAVRSVCSHIENMFTGVRKVTDARCIASERLIAHGAIGLSRSDILTQRAKMQHSACAPDEQTRLCRASSTP